MDAKFNKITVPIAERVLKSDLYNRFDSSTHFLTVVGHELSHGLGFTFSKPEFKELGLNIDFLQETPTSQFESKVGRPDPLAGGVTLDKLTGGTQGTIDLATGGTQAPLDATTGQAPTQQGGPFCAPIGGPD